MSLGRLRRQWEAHGRRNALAAILTPSGNQPEWDEGAFLETGRSHVAHLMQEADRLAPHRQRRRALDFGCGIGRLTVALADYYGEVVGVDIASSMVEKARRRNPAPDRIRYEHNTDPDLLRFPSGGFDLVCSWIVLQHMAPSLIKAYITDLVRLVAPGGLLVFQLPVDTVSAEVHEQFVDAPVEGSRLKRSVPAWLLRPYRELKYHWFRRSSSYMAMNGLAREDVISLVERAGGQLLEVRPDHSHGTPCPGFSYWVTKT
jgi:SAM-dependent methyltransferase